ncbi:MAG: hypothetical protein RSC06_00940 [Clostridia bacterium]
MMDRLTELYEKTKEYLIVCGRTCTVCEENRPLEACSMQDAVLQKCGQYEDSGLEPQDVPTALEMAKMYAALKRLKEYDDSGLTPERAQELGKADAEGRVVAIHPNQRPSLSFGVRPSCWYTDKPNGYFCIGFCHGDIDDEPIDACKRCTWLDGNEDFREEAEAALAKMREENCNEQAGEPEATD